MEETNRKHAELKKERDKLTNERKCVCKLSSPLADLVSHLDLAQLMNIGP